MMVPSACSKIPGRWIKEWVALRKQCPPVPLAKIARQYGVSPSIVHRYTVPETGLLGGWGSGHADRKFDHDEARRLEEEEGWTRTRIARHFGVTGPAITRVLGPKRSLKHDPWKYRRAA